MVLLDAVINSGVTRGSRGGRPPPGAGEKGEQNELISTYFNMFCCVKWSTKGAQN